MSAGSVPAVAAPSWRLIVTLDRQDIVSDCKAAEATDLRPDLAIMGPRTSARACSKPEKAGDLRIVGPRPKRQDQTMGRLRFAVIMLAWGMAARGAEVGDADSAMAARIEFLRDANAKMNGRLEKIRGAISYWAEQGFTADKDEEEEEGPAASAEPASASGRGRRLESKLPGGVKVWQGGVLHNFQNAQSCEYSMVKVRPCSSAPPG